MTVYQFVGVDVAKDKFDIACFINNKYQDKCFDNNKKGWLDFLKWLQKNVQSPWVCMEATGHYSEVIADFLYQQSIRVSIVNALQIKSFARMKLTRNKNDIIDARIIAEYCEKMLHRTFTPRSATQKELKDLSKLLDTLKEQLVQFKNQLHSTQGSLAKKALQKFIRELEKKIESIEKQLDDLISSDNNLNEKMELITSIKGVGEATAYKVLAQVPNIDNFSNAKQFAAFIGISPKQNQSGKYQGRTTISRIGDGRLRKALYMAALVAKRHNSALQPFVKRLELKGKAPKSIICAVMRKLAHIIFGILKHRRSFDAKLA
jgi:transposase